MDAGNMLKPMLARGELRMVGATTLDEYRTGHREGPGARAPLPAGAGRRAVRRGHHRDPARAQGPLRGAPQGRDRRLGARRRGDAVRPLHPGALPARQGDRPRRRGRVPAAHGDRQPAGRDRRAAARRRPHEDGGAARSSARPTRPPQERLAQLRRDLADRSTELAALTARWEQEQAGLNRVGELKQQLDQLQSEVERAQREGDLTTASRLSYAEIPALQKELAQATAAEQTDRMVEEQVGPDDIAAGRQRLDRHPRRPDARGRDRQAAAHGGRARAAPRRPGAGGAGRVRRRAPRAGRHLRPRPARPARSCSSARPASARPSWPRRSPSSCSTTSAR